MVFDTERPRSVSCHLRLLSIAVTIPILLSAGVMLWRYADAEQRKLETRGIASVREISDQLDADTVSLVAILRTLSGATRNRGDDYQTFFESAEEVTRQIGLPIILSDRQGHTIFNTRTGLGGPLPDVEDGILHAAETKQPTVTDLYVHDVARGGMYAVAVPVFRRGTDEVTHVLAATINTRRVRDMLVRNSGQQDRASVIDRAGHVLARTQDDGAAPGPDWPGFQRAEQDREGVFRQVDAAGVEKLTSFTHMRSTNWIVVNDVDSEVVDGPFRRLLFQLVAIAGVTALTAGAIGFILSRRLLASLETLEVDTIRIGVGAPLRRVSTPVSEVNRIGEFLFRSSTELKLANEAREALLYEVNHRVKNSLAVVTSILSMQARQTLGSQEKRALLELRSRIDIIARVHQSLYESGHHNSVNVGDFLDEVATTTVQALDAGRGCVLTTSCEPDVVLPVYRTTPLALIAAELITNAVKHARNDGDPCAITMRFARDGRNGLSLMIADDGRGLAADFDPTQSSGVGMRIITGLLKQLRAHMSANPGEPGARFLITLEEAHRE
jgi:two-component sensor histidine kinase